MSQVARIVERLLEGHRREDGRRWGGVELERATGGVVTRSYVINLRKGRLENPGYEKMLAIAKAMGFPPEAWFDDVRGDGARAAPSEGRAPLRHHRAPENWRAIHERRGRPHERGGAHGTGGRADQVRRIPDPTVGQVAALAAVFGVEPSYLMDREGSSPLDAELLEGLRDETTREITREAMHLPERERRIVLGIVRQFEAQRGALAREEPSGK